MNPSEVLRQAARVIKSRGLCKGSFSGPDGVCLLGAINVALGLHTSEVDAFRYDRYVEPVIADQFPEVDVSSQTNNRGMTLIPYFNDLSTTTKEDVVMVLEKAAVRAEETGV